MAFPISLSRDIVTNMPFPIELSRDFIENMPISDNHLSLGGGGGWLVGGWVKPKLYTTSVNVVKKSNKCITSETLVAFDPLIFALRRADGQPVSGGNENEIKLSKNKWN